MTSISDILTQVADTLCGYPLFITLIGGGLFLFLYSGMVSVRLLPNAISALRESHGTDRSRRGITSAQALMSVVAATVGMGNIAGVAIALAMGGPGAIFWMWVSAIVGMSTKYHEGVLAILHRSSRPDGTPTGGPMYIITSGLGRHWRPLAVIFAIAGMFGTLCIINANQLAEALASAAQSAGLADDSMTMRMSIGVLIALIVGSVVMGGIKRIASVATVLVPFMVTIYFIMVAYIVMTNIGNVPDVFASIFRMGRPCRSGDNRRPQSRSCQRCGGGNRFDHALYLCQQRTCQGRTGSDARSGHRFRIRMHSDSCCSPARRRFQHGRHSRALDAFGRAIPFGEYMLTAVVTCFALSSMFTYSFYGSRCAANLFGDGSSRWYTLAFTLSLILFATVPLSAAVAMCDLFYALMAFPTMFALIMLRKSVRTATRKYFNNPQKDYADTRREAAT